MATEIPFVPGDPEQIISIALEGETYTMRARWVTRDDANKGAWYLDVYQRDGTTPIAVSIKLVLGVLLGRKYNHILFKGGLFLVDFSATGDEPRLNDLGGRVVLLHMNMADKTLTLLPRE